MPLSSIIPARYWHHLSDGRVQCDLCPRYCRMREGQRGLCFVRGNGGNGMVLTSWGRTSGFCIDPIEKKPLFHFLPGTAILSFGSPGCNLNCKFCQNWGITRARDMDRLSETASPERIAEAAAMSGCHSVAFTYNDPIIYLEYAVDVAAACHERGIKTATITAGYITPQARREFFAAIDAANVDLKSFSENFYHSLCGGHLAPVLDTLLYLRHETSVWLEITTLLIPGQNDSDAEIGTLSNWISNNLGTDIPMHFSAFHPDWKMLNTPGTHPQSLERARDIAHAAGLKFVYIGNIIHENGSNTFCPNCAMLVIERNGRDLGKWNLDSNGCCKNCGNAIPGRFEEKPGDWGGKIQPLRL